MWGINIKRAITEIFSSKSIASGKENPISSEENRDSDSTKSSNEAYKVNLSGNSKGSESNTVGKDQNKVSGKDGNTAKVSQEKETS